MLGEQGGVVILHRIAGRTSMSKDTTEVSHVDTWEKHSRQRGASAKALRHVHISAHLTDLYTRVYKCSLTPQQARGQHTSPSVLARARSN